MLQAGPLASRPRRAVIVLELSTAHHQLILLPSSWARRRAEVPERPPIIFVSQHGSPGDYDPLARPAEPAVKADDVIAHQRSMPTGVPCDLPRGATGTNGHGYADPGPGDEGEEALVVIRG